MQSSKSNISKHYLELKAKYGRLGNNVQQAIETFLKEQNISYLSISFRVKELDSFLEKIDRKGYKNPFDEIEDICGIRIICYYQSDIAKIQGIIEQEFEIKENQNKQELLEATQFGYRSFHFIARVKKEWTNAPNYRNLELLKFEIQVRTILMHSWAEIEHKLSYKSESHIPKGLRRKFSRISAKLEEADEQFEEIKDSINSIKHNLIENANKNNQFDYKTELNQDSLQAFLDYAFENREKDINQTGELLKEMQEYSISFEEIVKGYEKHKETLNKIEQEQIKREKFFVFEKGILWAQSGAIRTLFELISDKYYKDRVDFPGIEIVKKFRPKK